MIGHLGSKVSALLDGQLSSQESERLWRHVQCCGHCREQVEHQGWVKTRLAGLAMQSPEPGTPPDLTGALAARLVAATPEPAEGTAARRPVRPTALAALSVGTMGAAFVGVLAISVPAQAPSGDRRGPVTSLTRMSESPTTSTGSNQQRRAGSDSVSSSAPAFGSINGSAGSVSAARETSGFGQWTPIQGPWARMAP